MQYKLHPLDFSKQVSQSSTSHDAPLPLPSREDYIPGKQVTGHSNMPQNMQSSQLVNESEGNARRLDASSSTEPNMPYETVESIPPYQYLHDTSPPLLAVRAVSCPVSSDRFACEKCPKTFDVRNALKRHMSTHSDERPFVCLKCESGFKRAYDLKRHVRLRHMGSG
jgi:uncharacterized Zn-finger protein